MKIIRTTLAIILLATASVLAGTTPTWPQFRGPNGSGIAEDAHLPIHFGPDTNLLWKTALPPGHSSPCLWDERIFLTAFDRERKKLETICLDRQTGKVVWRRDAPAEKIERVHTISNPAASTPATDGRCTFTSAPTASSPMTSPAACAGRKRCLSRSPDLATGVAPPRFSPATGSSWMCISIRSRMSWPSDAMTARRCGNRQNRCSTMTGRRR
jgi:hypothetical protein